MSEYIEPHTISRIIGTLPGYIGYGQGGLLTEAVSNNQYSVVLLDKLKKLTVIFTTYCCKSWTMAALQTLRYVKLTFPMYLDHDNQCRSV